MIACQENTVATVFWWMMKTGVVVIRVYGPLWSRARLGIRARDCARACVCVCVCVCM